MRNYFSIIILGVFCQLALPALASAESCVTADCHGDYQQGQYVHSPVAENDCLACHASTGQTHPGEGSIKLTESEPGLCLQCHEDPTKGMAFPHSAVEEGCTGCHDPHQSNFANLVIQKGGELCLTCHEVVMEGEYAHGPVRANNCAMCHEVHGGEHEAMLKLPGKDTCFACHGGIKEIIENSVSQHDPVVNGVCWDCHEPHSADFEPFLEGPFPEGFYAPFDEKAYKLCFKCHSETTFTYWLTSEATNFRNRHSNLHSFHVNRMEKGRVCRSCHAVHGADQMNLLYGRAPGFGRWDIPIYYAQSETGGGCLVGCHGPKLYDREKKFKNR